jgi:hypothetical protein
MNIYNQRSSRPNESALINENKNPTHLSLQNDK